MEGVGDRFIPLALEEGQTCRCHIVLVLSVEVQRLECAIHQRMAVEERQCKLSVFVHVCCSAHNNVNACDIRITQQLRMTLELLKDLVKSHEKVLFLECFLNCLMSSLHSDRQ